jgi:hypothetical protein
MTRGIAARTDNLTSASASVIDQERDQKEDADGQDSTVEEGAPAGNVAAAGIKSEGSIARRVSFKFAPVRHCGVSFPNRRGEPIRDRMNRQPEPSESALRLRNSTAVAKELLHLGSKALAKRGRVRA